MNRATVPPVLAVASVSKRFGRVTALDGASLDLHAGEIHVLLGENGAGKSTLLALLTGRLPPDSGQIRIDGRDASLPSPRAARRLGIAAVYQHAVLAPTLTVAENIMLAGAVWWRPLDRRRTRRRLADLISRFGLAVQPDARVGALTVGERQDAELLRALSRPGRVLLADEPTAVLTPAAADRLGHTLRELARDGWAILLITHRLAEALQLGNRISVLRGGRLVASLDPGRLRSADPTALTSELVGLMFGKPPAPASPRVGSPIGRLLLEADRLTLSPARAWPGLVNVSVHIAAGEILGIAGLEGQGQQLLARVLAGEFPADHGRVRLAGRDLAGCGPAARRRCGLRYLTDDRLGAGTVGALSIARNLLLKDIGHPPFWTGGITRRGRIAAFAEAVTARAGIRKPVDQPVASLSGGNVQRLLLARELDGDARALVLHNPTHGLDLAAAELTRQRIRECADQGAAVLLLSSDLDELLLLCDRIAVMTGGRLAAPVANGAEARADLGHLMAAGV